MSRFWPVGEAAQADYERLRAAVLAATAPVGTAASRFNALGLWGLIRRPVAEPVFAASMHGAARPPWTPYGDPRLERLAEAYLVVISGLALSQPEPAAAHGV